MSAPIKPPETLAKTDVQEGITEKFTKFYVKAQIFEEQIVDAAREFWGSLPEYSKEFWETMQSLLPEAKPQSASPTREDTSPNLPPPEKLEKIDGDLQPEWFKKIPNICEEIEKRFGITDQDINGDACTYHVRNTGNANTHTMIVAIKRRDCIDDTLQVNSRDGKIVSATVTHYFGGNVNLVVTTPDDKEHMYRMVPSITQEYFVKKDYRSRPPKTEWVSRTSFKRHHPINSFAPLRENIIENTHPIYKLAIRDVGNNEIDLKTVTNNFLEKDLNVLLTSF